jgi:hypothetical protein
MQSAAGLKRITYNRRESREAVFHGHQEEAGMKRVRNLRALALAAPTWVIPMAAAILAVSLVFLCVPAVEAG